MPQKMRPPTLRPADTNETQAPPGSRWTEKDAAICARFPDVVAAYESRWGTVALLLRHTIAPLPEERMAWRAETRSVVRAVLADLRRVGPRRGFLILQWRPLGETLDVMRRWRCRYDADPLRRTEVERAVEIALADRRWLASQAPPAAQPPPSVPADASEPVVPSPTRDELSRMGPTGGEAQTPSHAGSLLSGVMRQEAVRWYHDMVPCWIAAQPQIRRELIFKTHRWIAGRVLVSGTPDTRLAQEPGDLALALLDSVPPSEVSTWRPWIQLAMTDLEGALRWPPSGRDQRWLRWLFLIPYSLPTPRRHDAVA